LVERIVDAMDHHDKRSLSRRDISRTVRVATGISQPLECDMTDVSAKGARLTVHDSQSVPQKFLIILNDNLSRWCEVMWRSDKAVGVQFTPPPQTVNKKPKPATPPGLDTTPPAA
jgi:hypothetical protein